MRNLLIILSLLSALITAFPALAENHSVPDYSRIYDPERDPFEDSREALSYAQKTDRRLLIELGGDWCSYCHILDYFIANNREVREVLNEYFVILKINVSDENMNEDFIRGLPDTNGYPHIFVAKNDGSIVFSRDTTRLLEGGKYSQDRFLAFLHQWGDGDSVLVD